MQRANGQDVTGGEIIYIYIGFAFGNQFEEQAMKDMKEVLSRRLKKGKRTENFIVATVRLD